ncbi:hypothetical protein EMIHUDRAFT_224220 [Emiliania huxleyi CCMP1516]|uniref:Uncharacterized protein n=2 Tax=Emiliania huxleyi TaxID=2903 RepID=A0A0D3KSQ9_EMIH1|nr:hypothetical protein EMIHUDRAFT_224220 [Emiliania huxleyi CCMP1516]EOD38794.1 hypothetical protein EMIHUDRAFT_224220 [Emiliania huxleyi CCMP1516]|eukprot:XP_005791223.1 hypothetical protein EMIHUDRAFT_224220 [Emiliania huxleyi CCMP1516]
MSSAARAATALALCVLASAQDTATQSGTNAAYKYLAAAQTARQATEQRRRAPALLNAVLCLQQLMHAPIAQELAAIQQRSLAQMKQQSRLEALELARDTIEQEVDQLYAPLVPSTTSDDQEARNRRSMIEKYEQRKAELEVIRRRTEKELS